MNDKDLEIWKEKTKGLFHITEYRRFWNYIDGLKNLCNRYEEEHKTTYETWKKDISLYNSVVDRIDKAIKYAKANMERLGVWNHLVKEMIKILRGEENDG